MGIGFWDVDRLRQSASVPDVGGSVPFPNRRTTMSKSKAIDITDLSSDQVESLMKQALQLKEAEKEGQKAAGKISRIRDCKRWTFDIASSPKDRNDPDGPQNVRLYVKNQSVHGGMKGFVMNRTVCELLSGGIEFVGSFPLTGGNDLAAEIAAQLASKDGEKITR